MSRAIPRESIDALRQQVDVALENYGIACTLYVPSTSSLNDAETLDVYTVPTDLDYTAYQANVFIEWSPNTHRVRKLGVFTEDESPMLAWFGRKASLNGTEVDVDIVPRSYFRVDLEFVPGNQKQNGEFEIVDQIPGKLHDAVIRKGFLITHRRVDI